MKMIFKYFPDTAIDVVFTRDEHVGIKCSLPQDYNDPYELFLGVDLNQQSDLLATYRDIVGEIPNLLTTCFSKSPIVSPMWAHYANNHKGFVIGFDVTQLQKSFPNILVREMSYREQPDEALITYTQMAARRGKPRDAHFLQQAVLFHAYFSKYSEWSYEQEVRAVNFEDNVEDVHGHKIFYIPTECVATIISGARSSEKNQQTLQERCVELEADFYIGKIGRSYPTPYLVSNNGASKVFVDSAIIEPIGICEDCSEPLRTAGELCPWCSISEEDQVIAAQNNPFRILHRCDALDRYMASLPKRPHKPYV